MHDGGRVPDIADVERVVLPRATPVRADPGEIDRWIEIPFSVVPERRRVGEFTELFGAVDEPKAADLIGRPLRHVAYEFSDRIVRKRERIDPAGRRG
jgi:hypothetical protein